jgi:hypothetical protein
MTEGQKIEIRRRLAKLHTLSELTATPYESLLLAALTSFVEGQKALLPDQVVAAINRAGEDKATS